jgi:hypothetical protein
MVEGDEMFLRVVYSCRFLRMWEFVVSEFWWRIQVGLLMEFGRNVPPVSGVYVLQLSRR